MPDNNEIFLDFWQNYQWPSQEPLYFRLYHDAQGRPLEYSRQDRAGTYIEVTPEQFALADMKVTVQDGVIVPLEPRCPPRLIRSDSGVACHETDVTVIVSDNHDAVFWKLNRNENH